VIVICVCFLCSFGGITINTEKEKCKNEEEFERKLVCKSLLFLVDSELFEGFRRAAVS